MTTSTSTTPAIDAALALVQAEVERACRLHPAPFRSAHEGLAIVLEEFEEFKAEVWRKDRDPEALRVEVVHLAAMAVRFVADVS